MDLLLLKRSQQLGAASPAELCTLPRFSMSSTSRKGPYTQQVCTWDLSMSQVWALCDEWAFGPFAPETPKPDTLLEPENRMKRPLVPKTPTLLPSTAQSPELDNDCKCPLKQHSDEFSPISEATCPYISPRHRGVPVFSLSP